MSNESTINPVVFVMIDGLRPDVLNPTRTPHLEKFRARSAYTLRGSSVMPSVTLPCHMSIFHSVPPTRHGIVVNTWQPMARPLPGLIDVAHKQNRRCAFIHNWESLRDLNRPETLAYSYFIDNCYTDIHADEGIVDEALRCQEKLTPDFIFVYFGTVDIAGHKYGWMEEGYLAQAARADSAFGRLVAGLPQESTILVHADHGGHERTHGTAMPEDMTIPWMIAGPTIRQGYEIRQPVSLLDTAPTLAHILGIPADGNWEGSCVSEIFTEPLRLDGVSHQMAMATGQ